jgi:hypothetical protein
VASSMCAVIGGERGATCDRAGKGNGINFCLSPSEGFPGEGTRAHSLIGSDYQTTFIAHLCGDLKAPLSTSKSTALLSK